MTGALSSGFNYATVRALQTIQALTESQAKGELETKLQQGKVDIQMRRLF